MSPTAPTIGRSIGIEANGHDECPRVLSIQSHVVHGHVGNKSAVFPLQVLGFEVDFINTVQFSTHTGYGKIVGKVLGDDDLAQLIEGLSINEVDEYTHLITGYSRSPQSLKQIAGIVKRLRQKNPTLVYVCDPVMGDYGRGMYVPEEMLPVYRDVIAPLADVLTPNQFEAEALTGRKMTNLQEALDVVKALHDMGVKTVVLSSTELGDKDHMIGLASSAGGCFKIEFPRLESDFVGTGDLFAALFLAWWTRTGDTAAALERTIATMQAVVLDTYQTARKKQPEGKIPFKLLELRLVQNKKAIEEPQVTIRAQRL